MTGRGPAGDGHFPVPDALAYLAGSWQVERTVRDLASGAEGRFTGTTVFGPLPETGTEAPGPAGRRPGGETGADRDGRAVGRGSAGADGDAAADTGERGAGHGHGGRATEDGLLHHESGTFVWQGTPRPAERTLRYLPGAVRGTAHVEFSDGRPFHDLDLRSGAHVAHHPCVADLYRGEFTVTGPDRWGSRWRVTGPAKDLVLVTDYVRSPGEDG